MESTTEPRGNTSGDGVASRGKALVFNIVWTGDVFWHLRYFVCSLIDHSDASFRFVANACTPDALSLMEAFAHARPDRVTEIVDVSPETMVAHGVALDAIYSRRDDGELFCFVDADIKANSPFLPDFVRILRDHVAVTSGIEVWNDDNVAPETRLGLGGRHFYDRHGFVYGSPHFGMYRRAPLDDTRSRWGVGFGAAGPDIPDRTKEAIHAYGHSYYVYDTGKVVNILLQRDGYRLCHYDHPALVHIGGMSHFISPPDQGAKSGEVEAPSWTQFEGMRPRHEVARHTAAVLRALIERRELPDVPGDLEPSLDQRVRYVRDEMIDLLARHGACPGTTAGRVDTVQR